MIHSTKLSKYALACLLVFGHMLFVGCSGGDQQQQEDLEASEDEEAASVDGEEANPAGDAGNQEFAGNENFSTSNQGMMNNAGGENISNDQLANLTDDGLNAPANEAALNAVPANAAVTNAAPLNAVPMNPAITNAAPLNAAAPMNAAAAPMDPAAASAVPASPSTGGSVKYVSNSGLQVVDQPGSTTVVGTLEQGDHPVVSDNGEWARLPDGKFVSSKGLTDKGVGRARRGNPWR